ncbi:hypothetical protein D6D01_07487 [Aureobasidium pullulans]|uniref:Uncharacterized protein n=1 Tax=Aureobasidium pullulans TaxID=5580 RepID=A0A4S9KMT1_AURPU|nr:hypothetical protein D6D01_07487 [Aureobasidium pullulans]
MLRVSLLLSSDAELDLFRSSGSAQHIPSKLYFTTPIRTMEGNTAHLTTSSSNNIDLSKRRAFPTFLIIKFQAIISPSPSGLWRTILPISPFSQYRQDLQAQLYLTPSRTTTLHFPSQDQAGQECLEMETEGCLEHPLAGRIWSMELAARPIELPIRLGNDGQGRQGFRKISRAPSSMGERLPLDDTCPYHRARVLAKSLPGRFLLIKSDVGGCGIPQGLLNLRRACGSARSWTVPLLTARPAQSQTIFLDRFSSRVNVGGGDMPQGLRRKPAMLDGTSPHRQPRIPANSPAHPLPGNELVYQPTEGTQQYLLTS